MNKSILISIRPEHVVKILNGDKTLELRKSVPKDFTGWVYIYVIKRKRGLILHDFDKVWRIGNCVGSNENKLVNGLVVARFWLQNGYKMEWEDDGYWAGNVYGLFLGSAKLVMKNACLTKEQIHEYGKGKTLYAWHIKQLEIFDKPKDLWDFHTRHDMLDGLYFERKAYQFEYVKKAPISWRYVYKEE